MAFKYVLRWLKRLFYGKEAVKLGLYGPPNAGKTTIANRICSEWSGEKLGKVSKIPHETKHVQMKENVEITFGEKTLNFSIIDTPGICPNISYKRFMRSGMTKSESMEWAEEAALGIVEALEWLDKVDATLVILDSTRRASGGEIDFIVDYVKAKKIPYLIVANKADLKTSKPNRIIKRFPKDNIIVISALTGRHFDHLYGAMQMFSA